MCCYSVRWSEFRWWERMMDECASFGILQVINLTGMVFQEDTGSRNILGGAEQSVSERRNACGRCRILNNRKRVLRPFDECRPLINLIERIKPPGRAG